jgi:hypothetical protein
MQYSAGTILAALSCILIVTEGGISQTRNELQTPSAFDGVVDVAIRSRALFAEAAKVIMHPRCMNCHPAGNFPLQGDDQRIHQPPAPRGEAGEGVPGLSCSACHTSQNVDLFAGRATSYQSIPGHPRWHLAPIQMAWEGKSVGEICRQLKDRERNGGRDLALLHEHMAKDDLVAYGWRPGTGRDPVPGTQELFGQLIKAWIDSGAHCP